MRYNLDLSFQQKRKFYKTLDIIDMVFYITEKDYKSIYTRDHCYQIRFNRKLYVFKSKSAVKEFQVNMNFEYTIKILELDDVYQSVFSFYRNNAHKFGVTEKDRILTAISGIEWQFKYFQLNRFSGNYEYYVTVQVSKIIESLKEILILILQKIRNADKKTLYLLYNRVEKLK